LIEPNTEKYECCGGRGFSKLQRAELRAGIAPAAAMVYPACVLMEGSMAKGQMRAPKEKKKPKADKNKKKKHQPFGGHAAGPAPDHPGFNPFAKKA
jgi:hypothetical protein